MSRLAPFVAEQVASLLAGPPIPFSDGPMRVLRTCGSAIGSGALHDRFTLQLSVLRQGLEWFVMFNAAQAAAPPDFVFDGDFQPAPTPAIEAWDARDAQSLRRVIAELVAEQRRFQHNRVVQCGSPLIAYEYMSTIGTPGFFPQPEVSMTSRKAGRVTTHVVVFEIHFGAFLAHLVDEQRLRQLLSSELLKLGVTYTFATHDLGGETAALQVLTEFHASPAVIECLGRVTPLPWTGDMYLADYIGGTKFELERQLEGCVAAFDARRTYVASLRAHFRGSLLEFDSVLFRRVSFLFEVDGFSTVVLVDLAADFPASVPTFTFFSPYHDHNGGPVEHVASDFPSIAPLSSPEELSTQTRDFIAMKLEVFKQRSTQHEQHGFKI